MQREFPSEPVFAVGAVMVDGGRVLLVRRGSEPLKDHWTIPGGVLELGESLAEGVVREAREETGLMVKPLELLELIDRIHRQRERIQFHYVIADYICAASRAAYSKRLPMRPKCAGWSGPNGTAIAHWVWTLLRCGGWKKHGIGRGIWGRRNDENL